MTAGREPFWFVLLLAALIGGGISAETCQAQQTQKGDANAGVARDVRSKNFILHTDLSDGEASDLLERLETMLDLISAYWAKPNQKVIRCIVARDLNNFDTQGWDPYGIAKIREGAGVTISRSNGRTGESVVYSVPDRGVPQHEAVHAYCAQMFGRTGPTWYSEGMAEMGQYWKEKEKAVNANEYVIKYIRESQPRTLREIVGDPDAQAGSWQDYAWRWALCHLLANNPNYSQRFRPLGLGLLNKQPVSFEQVYSAMADEIAFEYLFFLEHLDTGYRVDLCAWDWKRKFLSLSGSRSITARIDADHGWQPSGCTVKQGESYAYSTTGDWTVEEKGEDLTADGASDGRGKLWGILLQDFKLSEPFELGAEGTFTAPIDGKLYFRCQDEWNELADNDGTISVKLRIAQ